MKVAQYREQLNQSSVADLERMLGDERKNLFMARRDAASKQLENTGKIRETRKNIARILTAIRSRELESTKGNE